MRELKSARCEVDGAVVTRLWVACYSPHLCVGFLFLILYPGFFPASPPASSSAASSSHTIFHTPLCHTPSFTHIFVNHHLSHTIFHTPSFTLTFTHHLSHTISHTPSLSHTHTSLSTTILHTPSFAYHLLHTPSFTHTHTFANHHLRLRVTGVALGDIQIRFAWQAWQFVTSTFVLVLRALGWLWWRAWTGLVAGDAAALCVAGVALGDIHLRFACGRRGQFVTSTFVLVLRALGWLWWRAWTGLVAGDAAALCVAGVALGDIHLRFAWQAWQFVTSTFVLVLRALGWLWWRAWTAAALCVAGVALGDMCLGFTWQAWHLVTYTFVLRGKRGYLATSTFVLRGRRGT